MTNPNNAIGTNGAFGGRTSVNAFNDNLSAWTRGIMSGWACEPDSGMTVALGGDSSVRDVAIAEDDAGNKTSINNISLAPVQVTIPGAPASNTRIDSIVAYVDNPPQGSATITDNYESCGIIVVSGTATSSPVPPNESTIRSAITADGATGATAYYVVLANVSVANGTTDITSGEIMSGDVAQLSGKGVVTADNIDFTTMRVDDMNFGHYTKTVVSLGYGVNVTIARIGNLVILQGSPIITSALPSTESVLSEMIPEGYRPITSSSINALCGSENDKSATWWVATNGAMSLISTGFTGAASRRVNVSSAWFTQDVWPSS